MAAHCNRIRTSQVHNASSWHSVDAFLFFHAGTSTHISYHFARLKIVPHIGIIFAYLGVTSKGTYNKMKVAVPEHQGRIAPVFDTCKRILIFMQTQDGEVEVSNEDWAGIRPHDRADRLRELEVDLLLCGGISCWMEERIARQGIKLVPWLAGELPDILMAYRTGTISDPCYAMPGRAGCRRRWRVRQGCATEAAPGRGRRKE